jgi:hypothetical protein
MRVFLKSIFPDVSIEHLDHLSPEEFVLRWGPFSYRLVASGATLTVGDVDTVERCPPPSEATDGARARLCLVHDPALARREGLSSSLVARLEVLAAPASGTSLEPGRHYRAASFGSASHEDPASEGDPRFEGVFEDVTADFIAAASETERPARACFGTVWQRLVVDSDPSRPWIDELGPGIVFAGNSAPAIAHLSSRERAGLLLEAGFADLADFSRRTFRPHLQNACEAQALLASGAVALDPPPSELLDAFRLHSEQAVQDECYAEMMRAAAASLAAVAAPEALHEATAAFASPAP